MDSPEAWRWVWILATAVFAIGELTRCAAARSRFGRVSATVA